MEPYGPLMVEHRLIERMIDVLAKHGHYLQKQVHSNFRQSGEVLTAGMDFFRFYGDGTHHGKEEDILFKKLAGKQLNNEHRKILNELLDEHHQARAAISKLASFGRALSAGDSSVIGELIPILNFITTLYPAHIDKEDNHFFKPAMQYLSEPEKSKMMKDFAEFDQRMIHRKYTILVEQLES